MTEYHKNKLEREQSTLVIVKSKQLPHGQFEAVLSTDSLDRHGEHVDIKGLTVPKDQVIKMYYNHETTGANLPIGKWLKIWKKDNKLMGLGEIDLEDDFAVKVYKKVLKGIIDSISIGFYPTEYDGETSTWTKSTLVEASVVAEPANTEAVITQKDFGFTPEEFTKSLKIKLKEAEEMITVQRIIKGAVTDVLMTPKKWELMRPFYDIMYAFEEAYYNQDTPATEFNALLTETIGLLQSVVDGTYKSKSAAKTVDESGDSDAEIKSAIEELKSKVGALEAAEKASGESPAMKQLVKVRLAGKQVDKAAEEVNKLVRIKLKETK